MAYAYEKLSAVGNMFTVAAAFGNVHGVYKPGNVQLTPVILDNSQKYIAEKFGTADQKPVYFVFHGGSGSEKEKIREAIGYGAIKMNLDTDMQWAFADGVFDYYKKNEATCKAVRCPEGEDKPNKKYYDPRAWLRLEKNFVKRS